MLIAYPVMMSFLIEQLINITDALFLGHVGEIEGSGRICTCRKYGSWQSICLF